MSEICGHGTGLFLNKRKVPVNDSMKEQIQHQRDIRKIQSPGIFRGNEHELDNSYHFRKEEGGTIDICACRIDSVDDEKHYESMEEMMSPEFYLNFEKFLSEAPPKLRSKSSALSSAAAPFSSTANSKRSVVGKSQKGLTVSVAGPKIADQTTDYARPRRSYIDKNLLRDAFAYTDHVLREAVLEERKKLDKNAGVAVLMSVDDIPDRMEQEGLDNSGDKKILGMSISVRERTAGESGSSGIVQKLRNKTQSLSQTNRSSTAVDIVCSRKQSCSSSDPNHVFSISAAGFEAEMDKKILLDMEGLVSNFENGLTLHRLKMELAVSKEAMLQCRVAMQSILDCYLGGDLSGGRRDWDSSGSLSRRK